jgi:hypothetical protein
VHAGRRVNAAPVTVACRCGFIKNERMNLHGTIGEFVFCMKLMGISIGLGTVALLSWEFVSWWMGW